MKIAVLSGKGGTGKTLVSVNLAASSKEAIYMDCDVEEPNGHLFLKPKNIQIETVSVSIPEFNNDLCNGCRRCVDFCNFNALAYINNTLFVFDNICHSCGGCILFCPQKALWEKEKKIGEIQKGVSENVTVMTGILNTGEASGVPIINTMLKQVKNCQKLIFIDCPPGSACIVMESIKDADYCLLVAEPTLFGVHNLNMVLELVKLFDKPHGVILNKCLDESNPAEDFCIENNLTIIGKIPFNNELGTLNSNAMICARETNHYKELFNKLLETIMKEVTI